MEIVTIVMESTVQTSSINTHPVPSSYALIFFEKIFICSLLFLSLFIISNIWQFIIVYEKQEELPVNHASVINSVTSKAQKGSLMTS